jgi:electron transport complex protein RnfD
MLGAFFIITDPVSSPDTARGLWLFGICVGVITFIIRSVGAYPDGVAFAVLLMNALVPLLDHRRGVTS